MRLSFPLTLCASLVLGFVNVCLASDALHVPAINKVPRWTLLGILKVETRSYVKDGVIVYVDQRRGTDDERGATQIKPSTAKWLKRSVSLIECDPEYAVESSAIYLLWLYDKFGSWDKAVMHYNIGPYSDNYSDGLEYLRKVKAATQQQGPLTEVVHDRSSRRARD